MQPARKLLSLLFLILMGTELTQVRASNAIFLPVREAPARSPGSPAKSGSSSEQRAPLPGAEPRGWVHARVPAALGVEGGVQTGRGELPGTPSPGPAGLHSGGHFLPRSSEAGIKGSLDCYCYLGGGRAGWQSPWRSRRFR